MTAKADVTLTDRAVHHLLAQAKKQGKDPIIRLGVKQLGCSGWSYTLDFFDAEHAGDQRFGRDGVVVIVDESSFPIVKGTQIDFAEEGLNQVPRFENPNVVGACGCGESFTVKTESRE